MPGSTGGREDHRWWHHYHLRPTEIFLLEESVRQSITTQKAAMSATEVPSEMQ
jgi:hypothetical protein